MLLTSVQIWSQTDDCRSFARNLIVNPGFEQGYYGFTSDFGRGSNNATHCGCNIQGWMLVSQVNPHVAYTCQMYPADLSVLYGPPNTMTDPSPDHPSNTSVVSAQNCDGAVPDHTTGSGYFLTVDPDDCPNRTYWRQKVYICPNTDYYCSFWVKSLASNPPPHCHVEIDGKVVTAPTSYPNYAWTETVVTWNSGNVSGWVDMEIKNDLPGCIENDVAFDDIFLGICADIEASAAPLHQYCPGKIDEIVLSASPFGLNMPVWQWQKRAAGTVFWLDIPGETDTTLVIQNPDHSDASFYRLTMAETGNITNASCRLSSELMELKPYPDYNIIDTVRICPGQQFNGHAETGIYTQNFSTIQGCDSIRTLDLRVIGEEKVYLANVFSPDGNGFNREIKPDFRYGSVDQYLWRIYDRWGSLIFESRQPGESWDGRYRGKECLAGVYAYILQVNVLDCQQIHLTGTITLLR